MLPLWSSHAVSSSKRCMEEGDQCAKVRKDRAGVILSEVDDVSLSHLRCLVPVDMDLSFLACHMPGKVEEGASHCVAPASYSILERKFARRLIEEYCCSRAHQSNAFVEAVHPVTALNLEHS